MNFELCTVTVRQSSCAEPGEDRKWAFCIHTCVHAPHTFEGLQSWVTKPTNTEYTPISYLRKPVIFYYPSIEQLSHTNPTPPNLDRITATAAKNFQLTFIQPMHLLVIHFGLGFTRAHNQANRVSGVDSTSLWGAYPGVLSDTPTECVSQCANIPSLKQTPNTMHILYT